MKNKQYDDYWLNELVSHVMDKNPDDVQPFKAETVNSVASEIGIDISAVNRAWPDKCGTGVHHALVYLILKLGERVVSLESQLKGSTK